MTVTQTLKTVGSDASLEADYPEHGPAAGAGR